MDISLFLFFFLLWKELRPFFVTDAGRSLAPPPLREGARSREFFRPDMVPSSARDVTVETKPREPTHAHTWHDDDDDDDTDDTDGQQHKIKYERRPLLRMNEPLYRNGRLLPRVASITSTACIYEAYMMYTVH